MTNLHVFLAEFRKQHNIYIGTIVLKTSLGLHKVSVVKEVSLPQRCMDGFVLLYNMQMISRQCPYFGGP